MKYRITTFGCQANEADSEKIAGLLEKIGYSQTSDEKQADVLVFNTCSVRQTAEDRVFGLNKKLKDLKTENLKLKTVLTGCMTHYPVAKLKQRLPYIDVFLPIKDISKLPARIAAQSVAGGPARLKIELSNGFQPKYQSSFRAFLPISEGCNNSCSYCIVPLARGKEVSRPAEEIICETKRLAKAGFKEIWLIGQNVNSYKNFPELLRKINLIPGNFWLRFTSPHPANFSDELIRVMAESEKFCHYLNLPVQSGDNEILRKMNRSYTIEKYKELVEKIRKAMPDIALSTDVIVGFPGETEKQFENTWRLFEEIKFDMAYISQYSPRPGTQAAELKDDIPKEEKKQREKILNEILKKTALENNQKYVGRTEEVLIEKTKKDYFLAKNRANKSVKIYFPALAFDFIGTFKKVKMNSPAMEGRGIPFGASSFGGFITAKIKKALEWGLEGKLC